MPRLARIVLIGATVASLALLVGLAAWRHYGTPRLRSRPTIHTDST